MKNSNIDTLVNVLNKKFGEGAVRLLVDEEIKKVAYISTGCYGIDDVLGIGGMPIGRIVEIFGDEQTGKTTLCYHIIKTAQKKDYVTAFIDVEHAVDPNYAKVIGVDLQKIIFSQPDSMEEVLDLIEAVMVEKDAKKPSVIVLDSIASLSPEVELEESMEKMTMGLQARKMSQWLRKIKGIVKKTNTCLVCTNQVRTKVGNVSWGNPDFTPGGRALKFYSCMRVELKRIGSVEKKGLKVGNRIRVRVVKNKLAVPFKVTDIDVVWGQGIDGKRSLVESALNKGIVSKSGRSYEFGNLSAIGLDRFVSKIDNKMSKELRSQLRNK